ncbi:hypothetical protein VTN96DRAFT_8218 [Rasamsonia emersonii]
MASGHVPAEFGDIERAQVLQIRHVLQHFNSFEVAGRVFIKLEHVMVSILASSRFSNMIWKTRVIERAREILLQASDRHLE